MKKIIIIGGPGSGKTYCARKLAQKLNIPVYHLDHYYYKPNWEIVPRDEFITKQKEIIQHDEWIIDGNSLSLLQERLSKADTVILLDPPRWQRIGKILWRNLIQNNPDDLPPGCTFSWRQFLSFLMNNVWKFDAQKKGKMLRIIAEYPYVTFYHFTSYTQVNTFLETLG